MTREEFTAIAIANGWTIVCITATIAIFGYPRDQLMVTTMWDEGQITAAKRERAGELTHYNHLREIEEDATRWIKAPAQIRKVHAAHWSRGPMICDRCGHEDERHAWWCWELMARSQHEQWSQPRDDGTQPPF